MPAGAWLELDLLRLRRKKYGLSAPNQINPRRLLVRGAVIGGGLVVLVFLTCLTLIVFDQWVERRVRDLQPKASRYDRLQKDIINVRQRDQKLKKANQDLAIAIAGLRSGSALLTEIARVVPREVQITKLDVDGETMSLSASSPQPLGLKRANAFQLMLEQSSFFGVDAVNIRSAVEVKSPTSSSSVAGLVAKPASPQQDQVYLAFELKAVFAPSLKDIDQSRLLQLGSVGLARRLQILTSEGLLK